jgi:hypothetical protein
LQSAWLMSADAPVSHSKCYYKLQGTVEKVRMSLCEPVAARGVAHSQSEPADERDSNFLG